MKLIFEFQEGEESHMEFIDYLLNAPVAYEARFKRPAPHVEFQFQVRATSGPLFDVWQDT